MECGGYGCTPPALTTPSFYPSLVRPCAAVSTLDVLRRVCGRVAIDERAYQAARGRFRQLLAKGGTEGHVTFEERLRRLRTANALLARRADAQLRHRGGRRGEASAARSCVGCSGDVVPEFDLGGCWPLWPQFAPDEARFRCERAWTSDPSYRTGVSGAKLKTSSVRMPMACWTSCWTPTGGREGARRCMAPCPPANHSLLPHVWRARWDRGLERWRGGTLDGRAHTKLADEFRADARGTWHQEYTREAIFRVF